MITIHIAHVERLHIQSTTSPELEKCMNQMAEITARMERAAADSRATAELLVKIKGETAAQNARIQSLADAKAAVEAELAALKAGGVSLPPEFLAALDAQTAAVESVKQGAVAVDEMVVDIPVTG